MGLPIFDCRKPHVDLSLPLNPFPREWLRGFIEYGSPRIIYQESQKISYSSILWIYNLWGS
jgi:hypothetical protein